MMRKPSYSPHRKLPGLWTRFDAMALPACCTLYIHQTTGSQILSCIPQSGIHVTILRWLRLEWSRLQFPRHGRSKTFFKDDCIYLCLRREHLHPFLWAIIEHRLRTIFFQVYTLGRNITVYLPKFRRCDSRTWHSSPIKRLVTDREVVPLARAFAQPLGHILRKLSRSSFSL